MRRASVSLAVVALAGLLAASSGSRPMAAQGARRNVIVFVADGLRHDSVNEQDTPALWRVRTQGVYFRNSHALFPTLTTANASAIATGHGLGDTGDFSNTVYVGYPTFDTGNFRLAPGTPVPFLENDQILADLDDHFQGNFLGEETLLALAAAKGYNTAAVGKLGPAAIQAIASFAPAGGSLPPSSSTVIVDDQTGTSSGLALSPKLAERLRAEDLPPEAPTRTNGYGPASQYNNGNTGTNTRPGTLAPNTVQQRWMNDVVTRGVLPMFESEGDKPFALVYWCRDPDGTQHNQGDSLGALFPGINGPTSRLAVRNADRSLQRVLEWLDSHPAVAANTDVFVTSDHGFATISRREIDRSGRATASESAKHFYLDAAGKVDTEKGMLPTGFLAIDLTVDLRMNLYDPSVRSSDDSRAPYKKVRLDSDAWEHPIGGNGLIGREVVKLDGSDAAAIIASNGGADLIYVPDGNRETVREIVGLLTKYDYVSGLFVDDQYGELPGALPLGAIGLVGTSKTPRPAIVVAFKEFYYNPDDVRTAVQVTDSTFQEGQGFHGGFGRDNTFNNMAALGPDFKKAYIDDAPVSNADIVPTLAQVMGIELKPRGSLRGRVAREALTGAADAPAVAVKRLLSSFADGLRTLLIYRELDGVRYAETGCFVRGEPADAYRCR